MRQGWKVTCFSAALLTALTAAVGAQQMVTLKGNLDALKCDPPNMKFRFVGSDAPGQIFLAGEPVKIQLFFEKGQGEGKTFAIEIQEIAMRSPERISDMKGFTDTGGHPHKISLEGKPVTHRIKTVFGEEFEVELPLPQKFGTYALVLAWEGKRQFLATVARVPQPRAGGTVDNTPVFGESALFRAGAEQAAAMHQRMGIHGLRWEMSWTEREDGTYDWSRTDPVFEALARHDVRTMITLGGHPWWSLPFRQPTPGWGWTPRTGGYSGTGDWLCEPKYYPRYGKWVEAFCRRYWKDGKGALWGIDHYNEPWEGGGISGWKRDCVEYRKLLVLIAEAAHKVDRRIQICAASSIMNTEDKLYADGSREMDKYIDVFTDHYVPPHNCYGPMVAKAHGKTSMETETWFTASEYQLPQAMCQFMACGQLRLAPWHPRVLFEGLPGHKHHYVIPTPVVVATAAFNWFATGKAFEKLVFHTHLPWVFQFGKDDDPEALLVMFGQLQPVGGDDRKLLPWAQVESEDGGTITLDNADGLLRFFDLAGNKKWQDRKSVTIPMSILPTYIRCDKGPVAAAARIKAARIEGKRPVEILPRDFANRVNAPGAALNVSVHNCLNRTVSGKLSVTPPDGINLKATEAVLELAAGETKAAAFEIALATPNEGNAYPFAFAFTSEAGNAKYAEALSVVVAPKGAKKIDGDLGDWRDVPGIRLVGEKQEIDRAEFLRRPWLDNAAKLPDGTFAELKLAWDENFLYVAAQVHDPTPQMDKARIEGRNNDRYFHTAYSDNLPEFKKFLAKFPGRSFAEVPYVYAYSPHGDKAFDAGDLLQIALDVKDDWHDLEPTTDRVPYGFHTVPDTDYEYSLYMVASQKLSGPRDRNNPDGVYLSELWRCLAPGVPRIHDFPRCPKGERTTGAVKGARHVVRQQGKVRIYEAAIPKEELAELELKAGTTFGFNWQVGNNKGPGIRWGAKKAVCKVNGLSFHPYWLTSYSCGVRWALTE